jgi:uncharacterized membrane protein
MAGSRLAFDPYPFSLLTMVVSLEAIFLSLFILMSQHRSGLQADRRSHLDLQINLLSEDENRNASNAPGGLQTSQASQAFDWHGS